MFFSGAMTVSPEELLSELLEERETLTDLSMMDPLTGLYNRRGLQSRLENLPEA